MAQYLINLSISIFGSTYIGCVIMLFITDYIPYVDQIGKFFLLILGVITGLLLRRSAKLKAEQAQIELETARLKLHQEQEKHNAAHSLEPNIKSENHGAE